MIRLLDVDKFVKSLTPVTSTDYWLRTGEFHPEGLFSESIFGPVGSRDRRTKYSYVNLHTTTIHPSAYTILAQLDKKVEKFLSTEEQFVLDTNGRLKIEDGGVTGIKAFIELFPDIKFRTDTSQRKKFVKVLDDAYKKKTLFIDKLPIIPPDFRSAFQDDAGNWVVDEMNDIYLAIIRRSFQVQSSAKTGPLFDLLNWGLQSSVIDHDKYIRSKIAKKNGIIRQQLAGKRVDFSGRAVITPGPSLKVNEIGLPFRMAVSLFEPFIIHHLLYSGKVDRDALEIGVKAFTELELSVDSVQRVLKSIRDGDEMPKSLYDLFAEAAEVVMIDRVVLSKRDPVLHPESIRAFDPKLVHGDTIQINTMQVGGFNADFDGDTMAVYHPLTNESQNEAKEKMMRAQSGESSRAVTFELGKEMYVGLYTITKDVKRTSSPIAVSEEDLEKATDPYIPVTYRRRRTTMGKAIFNSCFPQDFDYINKLASKKVINVIVDELFKKYEDDVVRESVSRMERVGFKFATIMAPNVSLDQIELPDEIYQLKKDLDKASTEEADTILRKMEQILKKHLEGKGIYDLVESGAARGWGGPMQILVAKGIVSDPTGRILDPIKGSFSEGLNNTEFFNQSYGSRRGIIDRVHNTAETGYFSRQLAYVLDSVELDRTVRDCRTDRTMELKLDKDLMSRMFGRNLIEKGKVVPFNAADYKSGDMVNVRTPIYCLTPKVCFTCYGRLVERHKSPYIGMVASQIIGERGTQLIMRTFHTGGAVEIKRKEMLKDIVSNEPSLTQSSIKKYLEQQESYLVAKEDCIVTIDLSNYDMNNNIRIADGVVWVKSLLCQIDYKDIQFSIALDYPVELQARNAEKIGKEFIKLYFSKNTYVLEVTLEAVEIEKQVNYVTRLLAGREIYKDVSHLFRKLFAVYKQMSGMDIVHLEVLISNVLRDRSDTSTPARLGKTWDPIMINFKEIVFTTGFVHSVAFEDIRKAVWTGLTADRTFEPSILEKVVTGKLVKG